ncbi:MAG: tryptophan--tRNA ligase [Candidatus Gracilibacteria bacterium]
MKKIITGVKPTGESMHLGNFMGAVFPAYQASKGTDSAIFIANLHALTSVTNGDILREQSFELAVEYFAIYGLDTETKIFRQSDIHNITKLMWILTNVTPYSLMLRAHSFKDSEAKNVDLNMGVFNYPILMAADILGYGIEAVPVGKDQVQHLEMTRDIARNFNKTYNCNLFIEPKAIVTEGLATLPGIDGRKMSKSYGNFIGLFDDEKTLKKRVMSIVTDSLGVDDIKNPDTCNVFALINVFATPERREAIRAKYLTPNAGYGYGHAKLELLEILTEYLRPYRENREQILKNPELVEQKLQQGAKIMNERLDEIMKEVVKLTGVK